MFATAHQSDFVLMSSGRYFIRVMKNLHMNTSKILTINYNDDTLYH